MNVLDGIAITCPGCNATMLRAKTWPAEGTCNYTEHFEEVDFKDGKGRHTVCPHCGAAFSFAHAGGIAAIHTSSGWLTAAGDPVMRAHLSGAPAELLNACQDSDTPV